MEQIRRLVQILWVFLSNGYWAFPWSKNLYQGPLKVLCSPGLNCYSCPAATTYCPIGSLQQLLMGIRFSLESGQYYFGTYVVGSAGLLGALCGRFICGWACPFGLFQELLHKIPSRKYSIRTELRLVKYFFLLVFVILLPLLVADSFGLGKPWFCKYLCPTGSLEAGIPMLLLMPDLRTTIGWLYWNKLILLAGFIAWSIVASRPFCRTSCPLGAFYALFNKFSLIRLQFIPENCTKCGACHQICPVEIRFNEMPDSGECIKCLRCMNEACRYEAISLDIGGFSLKGQSTSTPNPLV